MGEAKRRGSREQREATAVAALRAQFPATVKCNNCQADLSDIIPMDVRGFPGLRHAGSALCPSCKHVTWALDGDQNGLDLFRQFLDETYGSGAVGSGIAKK